MFKLFSKRKKFSKENLVHQCTLLEKNPKVNPRNKQLLIETLRQIAELMIWGDQNDDSFFHIIAERNILGYFLSIVQQKYHRSVTIQVMQTLSIMIQNISKQQSLYYLFSNNYINDLVVHDFDFTDTEILPYYVSFLKTISLKLDENVINFFFNAKAHDFPLYSEALKFFKAEDQMVRIAVRTLTLNVYRVDDPDLRKFITDKSAVPYFSNLTWFIRDQCIVLNETLDKAIYGTNQTINEEEKEDSTKSESKPGFIAKIKNKPKEKPINKKTPTNQLQRGVEEQVDHYYYLEDIFLLGLRPLSDKLMNQLLSHIILPVLVGSLVDVEILVSKQREIELQYEQEMNAIDNNTADIDHFDNDTDYKQHMSKSTSAIEVGDDDTQKASTIRKFLERRTRISKQLSLFLLTQVLTVFSDGSLINAIIVALMHTYPPKLVNQIVLSPPQHAVESSIPISHVLCQKRSYFGRKNSFNSSGPSTPITDEQKSDEQNGNNRSKLMKDLLENDEQNKIVRSRIESVEKMDIITEDSRIPEETNIYRNGLLLMLNSDPTQTQNEQLIASTAALILTIIRNRATSEELLIAAGICPQKRKRKRQLFSAHSNINNGGNDTYATMQGQRDKKNLLLENEPLISSQDLFNEDKEQTTVEMDVMDSRSEPDLTDSLPSPKKHNSQNGEHGHSHTPTPQSHSNNIHSKARERERSSSEGNIQINHQKLTERKHKNGIGLRIGIAKPQTEKERDTKLQCDYPFEFVECIINVLSQCSKLSVFTIRVLSELLIDFVQDRTMKNNGLNDKHNKSLLFVWGSVKQRLSEFLPLESGAMETYFIDTFEEEWRSVRQQPRIETLIANPIRILPPSVFHASTETNTNKKTEKSDKSENVTKGDDQQQLIRKLERIRKSIHNLLHISRLKTELLGGTVSLPFIPRTEFKYYYRLQIALSTIAPGCLNCLVLMQNKKRRRVLFSIREPDWLLLFNRMKGRAGFAMIYMAIPIHTIEGVLNKLDPRVVHLSIRSPVRPHDAAIPISSQKNKWSITLFFDSMFATNGNNGKDQNLKPNSKKKKGNNENSNNGKDVTSNNVGHKDALTALDYITMNRMRVRRKMMTHITEMVVSDTSVNNTNAKSDENKL